MHCQWITSGRCVVVLSVRRHALSMDHEWQVRGCLLDDLNCQWITSGRCVVVLSVQVAVVLSIFVWVGQSHMYICTYVYTEYKTGLSAGRSPYIQSYSQMVSIDGLASLRLLWHTGGNPAFLTASAKCWAVQDEVFFLFFLPLTHYQVSLIYLSNSLKYEMKIYCTYTQEIT